MIMLLLVCLIGVVFFFDLGKRLIYKDQTNIEEMWKEMERADWFIKLMKQPHMKEWILSDKENGLLQDPYYIRKILNEETYRDGFIKYVYEKTKTKA